MVLNFANGGGFLCQSVLFCLFLRVFRGWHARFAHKKFSRHEVCTDKRKRFFVARAAQSMLSPFYPSRIADTATPAADKHVTKIRKKTKRKDNSNTRVCNVFHIVISESSSGRARYMAKPTQLLPFTIRRQAFTATSPERKAAVAPTATADHCTEA